MIPSHMKQEIRGQRRKVPGTRGAYLAFNFPARREKQQLLQSTLNGGRRGEGGAVPGEGAMGVRRWAEAERRSSKGWWRWTSRAAWEAAGEAVGDGGGVSPSGNEARTGSGSNPRRPKLSQGTRSQLYPCHREHTNLPISFPPPFQHAKPWNPFTCLHRSPQKNQISAPRTRRLQSLPSRPCCAASLRHSWSLRVCVQPWAKHNTIALHLGYLQQRNANINLHFELNCSVI
jgi:hypothetical protein